MPRARLSANGIDVAKPGYDVDTAAPADMLFSSSLVAMRVAMTGVVTPGPFTGLLDNWYLQSIVTFPTPFPRPPIVLVAGLNSDGTTDQTPFSYFSAESGQGTTWPYYEVKTYTDRFELCVINNPFFRPSPADWRYWVFQNTLDI